MTHLTPHRVHRVGWLRAAVLGANDGIVSTASLVIGVCSAGATHGEVVLAGAAGLVAGAMSMAAGEYVSVSSQADTERADLDMERQSIREHRASETRELAEIYQKRGLTPELAAQVAVQLMAHDALGAHARDDIGIAEVSSARPLQAALSSALAFSLGAALPLSAAWLSPLSSLVGTVALLSLVFLALLGALAAFAGGAPLWRGASRVVFWGALAMASTALVGHFFEVVV